MPNLKIVKNSKIYRNILLAVIAIVIAVSVFLVLMYANKGFLYLSSYFKKPSPYQNSIILFYQNDCLHCVKVDNFIKDNNVESKVKFVKLNVSDSANANILSDKAQTCGLDIKIIGVPFLWDGKTCILGDAAVISFFKSKISTKKP